MDNRTWFREAQYGMMCHFGLYSMLGGEHRGRRTPTYAEWAQSYFAIPNKEYSSLASAFNPVYFNADEWISLAKDCGMKYFVITSKHHDGFALFKSEADPFNVVDATPFGRDIIGELAEACYKHGLKFGLYYSQELDWHHHDGGGYTNRAWCSGVSWHNSWDYGLEAEGKDFTRCFNEKIKPQVKEILTKYGDLCLIWFDTPHTISPEQSRELYDLVKHYQPNCLVNSRIGNGMGDYHSTGDNQISYNAANPDAELYECPATLNDTWGYKAFDQNWKNPARVKEIRDSLLERGINYLLNVGPDALGRIPGPAADILRAAAPDKQ